MSPGARRAETAACVAIALLAGLLYLLTALLPGLPWVLGTKEPAGYVRYVDAHSVAFGFDHWGIGGLVGAPLAIDYSRTHRIAITFQSLYPGDSPGHASSLVRVTVGGRTALEGTCPCHPSLADQVTIGRNLIGGSTCGPAFSGRILSVERFPEPRE